VKAKLDKGFLLVNIQLAENLSSIQEMLVVHNLLNIPRDERQVEQERYPITIDQEEEGQEAMYGRFRDDIRVEPIAEVDGINIITLQIAVHNREEHLEEQVHGINNDREQVQPCFAGHHGGRWDDRTAVRSDTELKGLFKARLEVAVFYRGLFTRGDSRKQGMQSFSVVGPKLRRGCAARLTAGMA